MASERTMQNFITNQNIGDGPVENLPGIGEKTGAKLRAAKYEKAAQVLGMYLALNCDAESFKAWLHEKSGAASNIQRDCKNGVKGWAIMHLGMNLPDDEDDLEN